MSRKIRADERREVLADQEADLDLEEVRDNLCRRPCAIDEVVFAAAFGVTGPPPGFDTSFWRQPSHLAALEHWATSVTSTPPEYRAFHLSLIRMVADEWPGYARYLRGKVVRWDAPVPTQVWFAAQFLDAVHGRGREPVPLLHCVFETIAGAHDHDREDSDRHTDKFELLQLGLTRQEQAWFVVEALGDPALRGRAVTLLADGLSGEVYGDVLACVLAGLIHDPDPDVRQWAVVQLAAVAPHTPGIVTRFWEVAANGYAPWRVMVYASAHPFDAKVEWALGVLGQDRWVEAGAAAIPVLVKVLSSRNSPLRDDALQFLAQRGVRAAAVLVELETLSGNEYADDEVRRASREALARLEGEPTGDDPALASPNPDEGFLLAVWRNPHDETTRLVYADWLDDHDHPERAEYVRLGVKLARIAADDPLGNELRWREVRLSALLAESGWRELWDALATRVRPPE